MPSEMDRSLKQRLDAILAPGGPLELTTIERFGTQLPLFRNAPPNLPAYFAHYCAQHGETTFLVDGDIRLSFAETLAAARALAGALVAGHGVRKGDRVGIAARNSANWAAAYMAVLLAGGCATLLNGFSTGEELADAIALAQCNLVLADPQRAARLDDRKPGVKVLVFTHGSRPAEGFAAIMAEGGGAETPLPTIGPEDHASVLFTSGSTGRSKGALSDHRSVVQATLNFAAQSLMVYGHMTSRGEAPRHPSASLVAVPLFHVTGEVPVFLQSFALGRRLVILPKWDVLEAMRLIEAEKVTYFVGVPLMSIELATHPERGRFDLSSCTNFAAGGAPRPADHVQRIRASLPAGFPIIGYGLTETNAVGCGNFNENYLTKPGSTGPASLPLVDLAIFGPDGEKLPQGEVGEVAIRSICNFTGYWNDPEATRAALREDGYFLTGDLGYLDEDGYLFVVDRKKDIIIRGGENISCIEVEQAIYAHPDIAECSVFGLPDERFGEIPAAVWLAKPGHGLTCEDLREFLAEHLAPFKIPARMWRAEGHLPRLGTAKVDKRALREKYLALIEGE
ncbi:acyl--CoA ligase [Altererythrobacter sp. CC-YST694]|uniref:class I adenylate-forming enzyme family protein n=1 Tax=Altererythrobacter sp. CC-YST694 TaxID=2755038 RepID=UPI001D0256E6|nr:class I adenylate-forming enzyme family protein [Altererythrobacter sp. CC-YST694]MCB5425513.1 acyl--CoA ligase [Altererythrobacter sp. CC-YST694]